MDICLPKFDIYQGAARLQIVLRFTQIRDVLIIFKKMFSLMSAL